MCQALNKQMQRARADLESLYPELALRHLAKSKVYNLSYGRMHECASALYSATVLVSTFYGVAFDPESAKFFTAEELPATAEQCAALDDSDAYA